MEETTGSLYLDAAIVSLRSAGYTIRRIGSPDPRRPMAVAYGPVDVLLVGGDTPTALGICQTTLQHTLSKIRGIMRFELRGDHRAAAEQWIDIKFQEIPWSEIY